MCAELEANKFCDEIKFLFNICYLGVLWNFAVIFSYWEHLFGNRQLKEMR